MNKRKISKFPVVMVCAKDWTLYNEQKSIYDKFEISIGYLIGFLIQEDKEKIVLAANYFEDGQVRETTVVPKEAIIYILNLSRRGGNAKGKICKDRKYSPKSSKKKRIEQRKNGSVCIRNIKKNWLEAFERKAKKEIIRERIMNKYREEKNDATEYGSGRPEKENWR